MSAAPPPGRACCSACTARGGARLSRCFKPRLIRSKERRLTPRSTGPATAGHAGRTQQWFIMQRSAGASYRRVPVSSNVRRRMPCPSIFTASSAVIVRPKGKGQMPSRSPQPSSRLVTQRIQRVCRASSAIVDTPTSRSKSALALRRQREQTSSQFVGGTAARKGVLFGLHRAGRRRAQPLLQAAPHSLKRASPNTSLNRTRNGRPRLGLISFWPKRALPLRAG